MQELRYRIVPIEEWQSKNGAHMKDQEPTEDVLTIKQAAREYGVPEHPLYDALARNEFPGAYKKHTGERGRGKWFIPREAFVAYLHVMQTRGVEAHPYELSPQEEERGVVICHECNQEIPLGEQFKLQAYNLREEKSGVLYRRWYPIHRQCNPALKAAKARYAQAIADYKDMLAKYERTKEELEARDRQVAVMSADIEELKARLSDIETYDKLQEQYDTLKEEYKALEEQFNELSQRYDELLQSNASPADYKMVLDRYNALVLQDASYQDTVSDLRQQLEAVKQEKALIELQRGEEMARVMQSVDSMQEALDSMKTSAVMITQQLEAEKKNKARVERQLAEEKAAIADMRAEHERLENERDAHKRKEKELAKELEELKANHTEQLAMLADAQRERDALQAKWTALQSLFSGATGGVNV